MPKALKWYFIFGFLILGLGLGFDLARSAQAAGAGAGVLDALRSVNEIEQTVDAQVYCIETGNPTQECYVSDSMELTQVSIVQNLLTGKPISVAMVGGDRTITYSPSLIGSMGKSIAMMYGEPPATTQRYVADLMDSMNIATPAYAQGIGFAALNPILSTWRAFRNIAYFFFVIIFIITGFMIMFRQKVGQAAVTAQQAIPHIIVSLLAVTFSYAIAGLLIDLMYIFMYLLVGFFGSDSDFITKNIFQIGASILGNSANTSYDAVKEFVSALFSTGEGGALNDVSGTLADGLAMLSGLTFAVVVSVAITIGVFRLFFELLKTYITIILSVTLSPLLLMLGALPGRNNFSKWVKSLAANLGVFPVTLIIFIVQNKLSQTIGVNEGGFLPPFLIGQGTGGALAVLLWVGMTMIATEVVQQYKKAAGASGGVFEQFGQDVKKALNAGWTGNADLIPGIAATNLAKSPLTSWMGGLGGANIARKVAMTAPATAGGVYGAADAAYRRRKLGQPEVSSRRAAVSTAQNFARRFGGLTGDKQVKPEKGGEKKKEAGH